MLELTVRDFGPIKSGTIALRPLTLLIGPNNVGKSYLALLAYALTGPFTRPGIDVPELPRLLWRIGRRVPGIAWPEDLEAVLTELAKRTTHVRYEDFDDRTRETLKMAIDRFAHSAASALSRELKRCFASEISELPRRTDGGTFGLSLHQAHPPLDLTLSVAGRDIEVSLTGWDLSGQEFDFRELRGLPGEAAAAVYGSALGRLFPFLFSSAYYFPAARSGILQAHRLLASALVAQASLVGIERIEVPKLSGVVADFIGNLLRLERRRRPAPLASVAEFIESKVCKGQVLMRPGEGGFEYPEIYYRQHEHNFPLHRASSMVSELAPIVLFLKYVLAKNDFLVIEEPEAHLHPDNQRILARAIVRLIRQGVRVLITTHSEYFLEQVSNFVRFARSPEIRKERGYDEDEYLSVEDVGAYLLRFEDDGTGSVVHELSVTEEDGIPGDEFSRIIEELYDETAALERVTAGR